MKRGPFEDHLEVAKVETNKGVEQIPANLSPDGTLMVGNIEQT